MYSNGDSERVIAQAIKEYNIPRHKLVLMTKAWSCVGEEQFHAYPILDALRKSKDCINQFGTSTPCNDSIQSIGSFTALTLDDGLSRSALFTAVNNSPTSGNRLHCSILNLPIRSIHPYQRNNEGTS